MWRTPQSIAAHFGCGAGLMGKKLFIVLSDCWYGGPGSLYLGVHMCERDSGCLVPGA